MGSKPKVRSDVHGTAIVFKINKSPLEGSEKKLSLVEIHGGFKSVIPEDHFGGGLDNGKLAIFIPYGNVVPDDDYFAWMGTGRRKIVRKRKILGKISDGVVVPLCQFDRVCEYVLTNGVMPGVNLAVPLGVFTPAPFKPKPGKPKNSRKKRTLEQEAKLFVEAGEKRGEKFVADEDGEGFKSTVIIPGRIVEAVGEYVIARSKEESVAKQVSERMESARKRAYSGGIGTPMPADKKVESPDTAASEATNTARLNALVSFIERKFDQKCDLRSVVPVVMGTLDGAIIEVKRLSKIVNDLTETTKKYTKMVDPLVDAVTQCPQKFMGVQCAERIGHTGPHVCKLTI